jgi:hypothetical protein
LPSPLNLLAGTVYYLSLVNNTLSQWGWLENDDVGGGGSQWFRLPSQSQDWILSGRDTDLAFELQSPAAVVPEPGMFLLAAMGMICAVGARRLGWLGQDLLRQQAVNHVRATHMASAHTS